MEEMMPGERGDTLLALHGAQCVPGTELSLLHTFLFNVFPTPTRPEASEHRAPTGPEAPEHRASAGPEAAEHRAPTRPEAPEYKAPTGPEAPEHGDTSWTLYCLCPEQNL